MRANHSFARRDLLALVAAGVALYPEKIDEHQNMSRVYSGKELAFLTGHYRVRLSHRRDGSVSVTLYRKR